MPPLLCLSPLIVDQSFPRDDSELCDAQDSLAAVQEQVEGGLAGLVLTECVRDMANPAEFDYSRWDECPQLRDICTLIQQWILQPHEGIEVVDVDRVPEHAYEPHPVPLGNEGRGMAEIWQDEVGRLLAMHDRVNSGNGFFIGIVCEKAFAGASLGCYHSPKGTRCFPLVGPGQTEQLSDAYEWDISNANTGRQVRIRDIERNYKLIGATSMTPPSRGSHFKLHFPGGRPWIHDPNYDPVPDNHLRTLSDASGLPVPVLRDSLASGCAPRKECRLRRYSPDA